MLKSSSTDSLTVCPTCQVQASPTGSGLSGHYRCATCDWELIVDEGGKVFTGTDASAQYLRWINEPIEVPAIRLRPFVEHLEARDGKPMLEMRGRIEDQRFIVTVLGRHIALNTVETGEDERGAFALLPEGEQALPDGFRLRLDVEYDELLPPGGVIELYLEGRARQAVAEHARTQGMNPEALNLIAPHERHFALYFGASGIVNGRGGSGSSSAEPSASN